MSSSSANEKLKKSYKDEWSAEKYLQEYTVSSDIWESFLTKKLHEVVGNGKIKGPRGIDVGCGPTIHRLSIIGRVCEELVGCDYAQNNLLFIKRWLEDSSLDKAYSDILKTVARLEGQEDEKPLLERVRLKLKHVLPCDITSQESVTSVIQQSGGLFDCAVTNGCLEAACLTYESYVSSLKLIASLLKPGAAFLVGGYVGASHYFVNGVEFECLSLDLDTARRGLKEAGFTVDSIHSRTQEECQGEHSQSNSQECFLAVCYKQ